MEVLQRFRLDGKVAVISNASSALGRVLAQGFGEAGADVVAGARSESYEALVDRAIAQCGRLDVLLNNVASAHSEGLASGHAAKDFQAEMHVSLSGTYWMARTAVASMARGGTIVNLAGSPGTRDGSRRTSSGAALMGVIGLTREMAAEWAERGVRVNAIIAGSGPSSGHAPVARPSVPDLCAMAIFLASDASSCMTGLSLPVGGAERLAC